MAKSTLSEPHLSGGRPNAEDGLGRGIHGIKRARESALHNVGENVMSHFTRVDDAPITAIVCGEKMGSRFFISAYLLIP